MCVSTIKNMTVTIVITASYELVEQFVHVQQPVPPPTHAHASLPYPVVNSFLKKSTITH